MSTTCEEFDNFFLNAQDCPSALENMAAHQLVERILTKMLSKIPSTFSRKARDPGAAFLRLADSTADREPSL